MPLPLSVHGATDRGLVHDKNEDSWAIVDTDEGGRLLVVCDGMGGMGRGDEASALAVEVLTAQVLEGTLQPPESLRAALRVADERVREVLCSDMMGLPGSTAVLVYVIDGAAHVAWVGDSRAYLVRGGEVVERTRDHKLVEELVDAGQITLEEARSSTLAHVVTRALGGRGPEEPVVLPSTLTAPWRLQHGDRIVLCSDGVCDLLSDAEVGEHVAGIEPDAATAKLVQTSLDRGGHDNITAIVASWEGPSWEDDAVEALHVQDSLRHGEPGYEDDGRVTEEIDLVGLEREAVETGDTQTELLDDMSDEETEPSEPTVLDPDSARATPAGSRGGSSAAPPATSGPAPLQQPAVQLGLVVAVVLLVVASWVLMT